MSVIALIPAHNEARTIAATVHAALSVAGIDGVVVVDDGSTDRTSSVAATAGAITLSLPANSGKGAALEHGISQIDTPDVLLLLDADLGSTASQAGVLLDPVRGGIADMTIATFPVPEGPAGFGLVKRLASWGIARFGGDFRPVAPLSGQRAIRGSRLADVTPLASGYGVEVALTIRALRSGMRVLEVPTEMRHNASGRDVAGFVHRGTQFRDVAVTLLGLALERRS